jgi:hypothetical protein
LCEFSGFRLCYIFTYSDWNHRLILTGNISITMESGSPNAPSTPCLSLSHSLQQHALARMYDHIRPALGIEFYWTTGYGHFRPSLGSTCIKARFTVMYILAMSINARLCPSRINNKHGSYGTTLIRHNSIVFDYRDSNSGV